MGAACKCNYPLRSLIPIKDIKDPICMKCKLPLKPYATKREEEEVNRTLVNVTRSSVTEIKFELNNLRIFLDTILIAEFPIEYIWDTAVKVLASSPLDSSNLAIARRAVEARMILDVRGGRSE